MCFFFNDTATTEIYTLSLHDALPIWPFYLSTYAAALSANGIAFDVYDVDARGRKAPDALGVLSHYKADRKSTRLNSSHANISYAVFCLKKKKHNKSHP